MHQGLNKHLYRPNPALSNENNGHSVGASCRVDSEGSILRECALPAVSELPVIRKGTPHPTAIPPIERAALLHEALHGGVFGIRPDKKLVIKAFSSIPPEDHVKIEELYQVHYGFSLKADLRSRLPRPLARRTSALLEGNQLRADIHTVYGELQRWFVRDIESVMVALRRSGGIKFEEVAQRLYHESPQDLIRSRLTGAAQERALLLAGGNFAAADATRLNDLLGRYWSRGTAVITFLESLSPSQRLEAARSYHLLYGVPLHTSIESRLSRTESRHASALLNNDTFLMQACSTHHEITKFFPSASKTIHALKDTPPEYREGVQKAYRAAFGEDLLSAAESLLKTNDATQLTLALTTGKGVPPAFRLKHALRGIWTDEHEVLDTLLNKTAEQIAEIRASFFHLTNVHLRGEISKNLSGRDKFRALLALGGNPKTAEDALALLYVQQEFEKLSLSHYILRIISKKPALLASSLDRVSKTYRRVWQDLELTGSERRELSAHLKFAFQDLESYKRAKEKVSEVASNLFMSASAVGLAAIAGPVLGPVNTLIFSTAGAALAKIAAKVVLIGRGYGWQSMPKDYLVGVLLRLRGQGGKRLFDATRTVIDLLS